MLLVSKCSSVFSLYKVYFYTFPTPCTLVCVMRKWAEGGVHTWRFPAKSHHWQSMKYLRLLDLCAFKPFQLPFSVCLLSKHYKLKLVHFFWACTLRSNFSIISKQLQIPEEVCKEQYCHKTVKGAGEQAGYQAWNPAHVWEIKGPVKAHQPCVIRAAILPLIRNDWPRLNPVNRTTHTHTHAQSSSLSLWCFTHTHRGMRMHTYTLSLSIRKWPEGSLQPGLFHYWI